jgi:AraC-like DNA-binding protein
MEAMARPLPWAAGVGSQAFAMVTQSLVGCSTLRDVLQRLQNHENLTHRLLGYGVGLESSGNLCALLYQSDTNAHKTTFAPAHWDRAPYYETVTEVSSLLVWYFFCGWLIGRSLEAQQVMVKGRYVNDTYADAKQRLFHCPVSFDSERTACVFASELLDARLVQNDKSLAAYLDQAVFQLIAPEQDPASTSTAIKSIISASFDGRMPMFRELAEALHMSESSLRRRLLEENSSYQQLKDEFRCELALAKLANPETKIQEIATFLGFTEPSSFVRSFKGWMGMTPKAYRDSLNAQ